MTSLAEACPNIVMESISNKCVTISNDVRPMPDFYKKNAFYYNNNNKYSLLNSVKERMSLDKKQESILKENLHQISKSYCWKTCFEKTEQELITAIS
jgi:predicted RNase H-like nuclease (RuvC/YqgF family)